MRFWDPDLHSMVKELAQPPLPAKGGVDLPGPATGVIFSPDGSLAVVEGWVTVDVMDARSWQGLRQISEPFIKGTRHQLRNPVFTADGR